MGELTSDSLEVWPLLKELLDLSSRALAAATRQLTRDCPAVVSEGFPPERHLLRAVGMGLVPRRGSFSLDGREQTYWQHGSGFTLHIDEAEVRFNLFNTTGGVVLKICAYDLSKFVAARQPRSSFAAEAACRVAMEELAAAGAVNGDGGYWINQDWTG